MFKTLFVIVGFTIETINSDNFQHSMMYLFCGLAWIIDFLIFFHVKLPKDLNYVCLYLAVAMEGILFKFHLYGLHTLEVILRMFLVYVLAAAFVVIILEMNVKTNILVSLLRPYFFVLHGTWIFQVGVILYYPVSTPWDPENYHNFMKTSILFTCHCGVICTVMVATYCLFSRIYKQKDTTDCRYKKLETNDVSDNETC